MVKFVENELQAIRTEISEMWTLVYQQLENAYQSVLNADKQLADKVVAREKRVNAFELKIDSDIEDCIALYNPVAIDLRFTLAMLKINTNLERMLKEMYDTVLNMLKTTHEALQAKDIAMAKSVFEKDEILDELNREAIDTLTGYATEHTASIRLCLETAGIFRKLERAGDHINNLAEETIFYLDAEVLKHNKTLFLPEHTV